MQDTYVVILSLASNHLQREHLNQARHLLEQTLLEPHYSKETWTEPYGMKQHSDTKYLNQLVLAKTRLDCEQLNIRLKQLEMDMGRTKDQRDMGRVAIDLDVLLYNGTRLHSNDWERSYIKELMASIPHPVSRES